MPKRAPFDLWQRDAAKGVKLYVQRVFIMDDADTFVPNYFEICYAVVDSSDLPLNVSRETLQTNRVVDVMRKSCTKRILDHLAKMAQKDEEKYNQFWDVLGQVLKEGLMEDFSNKEDIMEVIQVLTTYSQDKKQRVFDQYLSRMKEECKTIYYVTADSWDAANNSPHLELFKDQDVEVLLLHDRIDECLLSFDRI